MYNKMDAVRICQIVYIPKRKSFEGKQKHCLETMEIKIEYLPRSKRGLPCTLDNLNAQSLA